MGKWDVVYERESMGRCRTVTVGDSAETIKLVSDPKETGPKRFEVHVTVVAHMRQGASGMSDATSSDGRLPADGFRDIVVSSPQDNHLSIIRGGDEDGTAYIVEKTSEKPGEGTSGGDADPFDD